MNFDINLGLSSTAFDNVVYRDQFSIKYRELMDEHSKHPVHENALEKMVELLIKNGANVNQLGNGGTPIDAALNRSKFI